MAVWENIAEYLPKGNTVIWEAFYNEDSKSVVHLRSLGCSVVYGNIDFFTNDIGGCIVTNPPFSDKERVINRLYELDKPFIITIPIHSLATRFIKNKFNKNKLQVIIPDMRIHFEEKKDKDSGQRKTLKRTPFDTIYVCYKMNLPRDILWL
eukprot:883962-Pyramimonas_sp.AAC.1